MAESWPLAAALALALVTTSACVRKAIPAEAYVHSSDNQKIPNIGAHQQSQREEARARLAEGYGCADPGAQLAPIADVRDVVIARMVDATTPQYRPMSVTHRQSAAEYPLELLRSDKPGAVGILLFIEADGSVSRIWSVCATDRAFVPFAERVVAANRYRPSTIAGRPVPDLAYQIVAYGIDED